MVAPGSLYNAPEVLSGVRSTKSTPGMLLPNSVLVYITPPCSIKPGTARGCHRISEATPDDVTFGIDRTTKLVPRKLLSWKSSYSWWNRVALSSRLPSAHVVLAPSSKLSTNSPTNEVSSTGVMPGPLAELPAADCTRSRL